MGWVKVRKAFIFVKFVNYLVESMFIFVWNVATKLTNFSEFKNAESKQPLDLIT